MSRRPFVLGAILAVALVGLMDAGYLAWAAAMNVAPGCTFIHGCDIVAASPLSHFLGVPWGFYGVAFYFVAMAFALWGLSSRAAPAPLYLRFIGTVGFLMSLYFLYLQPFVIHAWCEFCLLSGLTATLIFILSWFVVQSEHVESGGHGAGLHAPGPGL